MERYRLNPNPNNSFLNTTTTTSQISLPPISPYLHLKTLPPDDSELSIFNAERYFNDESPADNPKKLAPISERRDLSPISSLSRNSRTRSFHTTPTASSEASWNSQTGLLKNPPGSLSVTVKSDPPKPSSSPCRRIFRRSCPCSGKKSVNVEENYAPVPKNPNSIKTEGGEDEKATKAKPFPVIPPKNETFRFLRQTVNSGGFSFPILASAKEAAEDPARISLEVFQPPNDGKLSDRRSFNVPGSPKDDDLASDASSDLFEIESLSTQMTSRRSYSVDEIPSIPSLSFEPKKIGGNLRVQRGVEEEVYPPSEVSVAWSVTTAANFSAAGSEFGENGFEVFGGGEGRKGGMSVGGLLSCRSEKAVCVVAPQSVRIGSSGFGVGSDRVVGLARLGELNPGRDGSGLLGPRSGRMNRMVQPINARVY